MRFPTYVIRDEFVNVCLCDDCWIEWAGGLFVMFHDGSEAVDFFFGVGDELDFAFGNKTEYRLTVATVDTSLCSYA